MVRPKNVKAISSIVDFDPKIGLLTANIEDKDGEIYEEYFDFLDVLRNVGYVRDKNIYFSGISARDICIKNL